MQQVPPLPWPYWPLHPVAGSNLNWWRYIAWSGEKRYVFVLQHAISEQSLELTLTTLSLNRLSIWEWKLPLFESHWYITDTSLILLCFDTIEVVDSRFFCFWSSRFVPKQPPGSGWKWWQAPQPPHRSKCNLWHVTNHYTNRTKLVENGQRWSKCLVIAFQTMQDTESKVPPLHMPRHAYRKGSKTFLALFYNNEQCHQSWY